MARNWWRKLFSKSSPVTRRDKRKERDRRPRFAPRVERLEDRTLLATSITVVPGVAGTGTLDGFLSATDGTITTADGGAAPGTLSSGALAGVGANVDIDIAASTDIT